MTKEKIQMLVAEDILKDMFEGKETGKAKELMDKMKRLNDAGVKELIIKTPMSHFLRALFLSDPETPIQNIQKVLSFITIVPSFADFKNRKECIDEIIEIAKIISGEIK